MISQGERNKMLKAHSIGPTMVDYLEMVGIETLDALKDKDAHELALEIDERLGVSRMNKMGVEALENLIAHALDYEE